MFMSTRTVILFWLLMQPSSSVVIWPKTTVIVTNNLEDGQDLLLHCQSADDDLGMQHLRPNASFSWSFHVNVIGTTLFHCSFQWKDVLHNFTVFKAARDVKLCSRFRRKNEFDSEFVYA
ncbi:unnamed protein product [Sphenostylis stenocarpa]|uniref:S-protein homolog n=1 Tax=Sphenostylis stenocarpa TaxID=92480 RepID=A0AA86W5A0_9FABA|nr:unnamed protein product [Sphenostylis stenocarpa]